jgi:transketolase
MLDIALSKKGPFYIRLPRGSFPKLHDANYQFSLRNIDILKEGKDICLIGMGYGSVLASQVSKEIENKLKLSLKIINIPCIKPINGKQLIENIKEIKGIVVIEEHNIYCGFGSILARILAEKNPIQIKVIGISDTFGQSGTRESLLNSYGFNIENIIHKIKELMD